MRLFLTALVLLWLQLFWSLVPSWRFGEYYGYGWYVPVLAAGLAWYRWQARIKPAGLPPGTPVRPPPWVWVVSGLAIICIAPLRLVEVADPGWRPPLLLHALLVFGLTQLALWQLLGRRVARELLPVTVFALAAVPYPWRFEQELIGRLSTLVIDLTHEVFLWLGRPVELRGERLVMGSEVVEVTDGCSGIRSVQSLVMVALFFGEMWWLTAAKRVGLVAVAVACAIGINTLRAAWLAQIQFSRGKAAAATAHDSIGHTAFFISSGILLVAAFLMLRAAGPRQRVVRRRQVHSPAPEP
jgi:exosortase